MDFIISDFSAIKYGKLYETKQKIKSLVPAIRDFLFKTPRNLYMNMSLI
jgi:hypothetical protein